MLETSGAGGGDGGFGGLGEAVGLGLGDAAVRGAGTETIVTGAIGFVPSSNGASVVAVHR